jgi:hypothetical protein
MHATLAADEIRQLLPALAVVQAAALLGIGRSNADHAVKTRTWPTRVVRVGRCIPIPHCRGGAAAPAGPQPRSVVRLEPVRRPRTRHRRLVPVRRGRRD